MCAIVVVVAVVLLLFWGVVFFCSCFYLRDTLIKSSDLTVIVGEQPAMPMTFVMFDCRLVRTY